MPNHVCVFFARLAVLSVVFATAAGCGGGSGSSGPNVAGGPVAGEGADGGTATATPGVWVEVSAGGFHTCG